MHLTEALTMDRLEDVMIAACGLVGVAVAFWAIWSLATAI